MNNRATMTEESISAGLLAYAYAKKKKKILSILIFYVQ